MAVFLRLLFLVPLGFVCAVIAAALVLVIGSIGPDRTMLPSEPLPLLAFLAYVSVSAVTVGSFSFLPMLAMTVVAELMSLRSVLIWLGIGGALGLAGALMPLAGGGPAAQDYIMVYLAAGFAGGFVHWLIAGAWSGRGLRSAPASGPA